MDTSLLDIIKARGTIITLMRGHHYYLNAWAHQAVICKNEIKNFQLELEW